MYESLRSKLAAAEARRKKQEWYQIQKLKEHAEHAKMVREKKVTVTEVA
jgi:hypothetical protein